MIPKVLMATTRRWFSTARLAMAMANSGFEVDVVCPPKHPISKISCVEKKFRYRCSTPLRSLARAIHEAKPNLIVPCDDLATQHLHDLYDQRVRKDPSDNICATIEASLGASAHFSEIHSRTRVVEIAREEGIAAPQTEVIKNSGQLNKWMADVGFPFVLKVDGTSGGTGIRIIRTLADATRAFRDLQDRPSFTRIAKLAWLERDGCLMVRSLIRDRSVVNAQVFVSGVEATSTIACWQGAVLASLHFEVLQTAYPGGPSTVLRTLANSEMDTAVHKMVSRLQLSGIYGFDFILDSGTGSSCLIEMNPRATQAGHLRLGPGRDIPAALYSMVSGESISVASKPIDNPTIALFPQEWIRDPASEFLQSAYHDIPWDEPRLVQNCIAAYRQQNSPRWRQHQEMAVPSTVLNK